MRSLLAIVGILFFCGHCGSNVAANPDAAGTACADLSGNWQVGASCRGAHSASSSNFMATVSQAGCAIALTQKDDNTPTTWVSTGTVDTDGKTTLEGDFGFTDQTGWAGQVTSGVWTGTIVNDAETCTFKAQPM